MAKKLSEDLPSAAEARTELARALKVYRAFEHADAALAVLENWEQVQREREAAATATLAELTQTQEALRVAHNELATVKQNALQIQEDAQTNARATLAAAEARATRIVREAEGKAAAALEQADAATAKAAEAAKELRDLAPAIEAAKATIQRAERITQAARG